MKSFQSVILSFLVLCSAVSSSAPAFAANEKEDPAFLQLLNDSATALEAVHSDIAPEMKAFAKEEADEDQGVKEPERTKEEKSARRKTHLKLYVEAATALETSHPELSEQLKKTAQLKAKKYASNPIQ